MTNTQFDTNRYLGHTEGYWPPPDSWLPWWMSSLQECEVCVCETLTPDGGVCEKCIDATMNSGVNNTCANDECDIHFMCDNCGEKAIVGYMGGEGSAFLCCEDCWEEVSMLSPSDRDYQSEQKQDYCEHCR